MSLVSTASESMNPAKFSISAELALPMYAGLISTTRAARLSIAKRTLRPRVGSLLVRAYGNARRQFVRNLVKRGGDRIYRHLNFAPDHRANFSR